MPRLSPLWIALACAVATSSSAIAAPGIWRCANSYSDTPCEGGKLVGPGAAVPTAEQRRQADEGTQRDQAAADRMERERIRLDAQPRHGVVIAAPTHAAAGATSSAAKSKPEKKKKTQRLQKPEPFVASYGDPAGQPADSRKKASRRKD